MADDIKTLKITTVGENKYNYEKEPGFPFTIVEGEVYKRVPAQRYEIVFPGHVNEGLVFGGYQIGNYVVEDSLLQLTTLTFDDSLAIHTSTDSFKVWFYAVTDGMYVQHSTLTKDVEQGQYGRYVISETQVAGEPVAYTLEPVYDYVLVD